MVRVGFRTVSGRKVPADFVIEALHLNAGCCYSTNADGPKCKQGRFQEVFSRNDAVCVGEDASS